jgi:DNA-binding NarL/FixJ family response regulator
MTIFTVHLFRKVESGMVRLVIAMNWDKELRHTMTSLGVRVDFSIIGTTSDCYHVLRIVEAEQPDIVIVDYYLGAVKLLDLIPIIKRKSPTTSVIIISPYDDGTHVWDALHRGASGYLIRKLDMDLLIGAIDMIYTGGCYVSHRIIARVLPKFHVYQKYYRENISVKKKRPSRHLNFITFSRTERQIIGFISQGRSTKEIAETLDLKPGTVRNYISGLMRKTGGRSRAQMIFTALNALNEGNFILPKGD